MKHTHPWFERDSNLKPFSLKTRGFLLNQGSRLSKIHLFMKPEQLLVDKVSKEGGKFKQKKWG